MTVWNDELHCFFVLDLTSKHSDVVINLESVAVVSIFFVSKKTCTHMHLHNIRPFP